MDVWNPASLFLLIGAANYTSTTERIALLRGDVIDIDMRGIAVNNASCSGLGRSVLCWVGH